MSNLCIYTATHMYILHVYVYVYIHIHVLMRDEKEGRKKQARSNKQQGKVTQHTQGSHFSKEKWAASGGTWTHDTLHSRQSALPLNYMYMYMYSLYRRLQSSGISVGNLERGSPVLHVVS